MLRQFLTDPRFLLRHYAAVVLLLGAAGAVLAVHSDPFSIPHYWLLAAGIVPVVMGGISTILVAWLAYAVLAAAGVWGRFDSWNLLWVPAGAMLGLYSAAFMHYSVHGTLRPRWLNRVVGELCALQQLLGYYGWGITHLLHHRHADDPGQDAHPPGDLGFWAFGRDMKRTIVGCLDRNYFAAFGDNPGTRATWATTKVLLVASRLARASFVLLLCGPSLFVFLFLPSFVTQMLFYVHFNWATHRRMGPDRIGIANLDGGPYYRFINCVLFGSYYHKNHHVKPVLFDPRRLGDEEGTGEPLISYSALRAPLDVPGGVAGAHDTRSRAGARSRVS